MRSPMTTTKNNITLAIAAAALTLGGIAGVFLVPTAQRLNDLPAPTASLQSGWSETRWPFPHDQFGRGKVYQCAAADCGVPVTLYVRAKIGFCNCATGVADDAELERIGDLELLGGTATAQGDGRPITVAWMKGRSRSYTLSDRPEQTALSIGYNDRCDAVVAMALVRHSRPDSVEAAVLKLLNGPTVMRWVEVTLGL
jgi:hypothetical protein